MMMMMMIARKTALFKTGGYCPTPRPPTGSYAYGQRSPL